MCTQRHTDASPPTHKHTSLLHTLTFSLIHVRTPSLTHSHAVGTHALFSTVSYTCPLPPCLLSVYTPPFHEHVESLSLLTLCSGSRTQLLGVSV